MRWIVLAIFVVLVPYTWLTLRYRKEGPAFAPYEDLRRQANVKRLLASGYQRVSITAQRPADASRIPGGATVEAAPGGLPEDLAATLVEPVALAEEILSVRAAPAAARGDAYVVELTCALPGDQQQLAGADLYLRGQALVLAPRFERVAGGLQTRSPRTIARLTVPPGLLAAGRYRVTLPAARGSRVWNLEIR